MHQLPSKLLYIIQVVSFIFIRYKSCKSFSKKLESFFFQFSLQELMLLNTVLYLVILLIFYGNSGQIRIRVIKHLCIICNHELQHNFFLNNSFLIHFNWFMVTKKIKKKKKNNAKAVGPSQSSCYFDFVFIRSLSFNSIIYL